jgi:hypothetical protein
MRERVRTAARVVLTCLLVLSLGLTGWRVYRLASDPLSSVVAERTGEAIEARLETLMAREATPEKIAARLSVLLAETPRDWARIDALTELAEEREVVLPEAVVAALAAANAADRSFLDRAADCAVCMWDATRCDLVLVFACRAPIEVTPIGDAASVIREGLHYQRGEDVDEIDLTLSVVGLGAVAIAPLVGGSSLTLKLGAGLTRTAWRAGALAPRIVADGRRLAGRAVDWTKLADTTPLRFTDDLAGAVRPRAIRPIAEFAGSVGRMTKAVGPQRALVLLREAKNPAEVRRIAAVAEIGGRRTPGVVVLAGAGKVSKLAVRWSDEAYWLVTSLVSMVLCVVGLVLGTIKALLLRLLRRAARPARRRRRT